MASYIDAPFITLNGLFALVRLVNAPVNVKEQQYTYISPSVTLPMVLSF